MTAGVSPPYSRLPFGDSYSAGETPPIETARDELQEAIPKAAETLHDLLDAEDERIQIRAAEAILERAGLTKAKQSSNTKAKKESSLLPR